jgi:hypothetical protein
VTEPLELADQLALVAFDAVALLVIVRIVGANHWGFQHRPTGDTKNVSGYADSLIPASCSTLSSRWTSRLGSGSGLRSRVDVLAQVLPRAAWPPAASRSRNSATACSIRRLRVSGFFARSIARTCSRLRL